MISRRQIICEQQQDRCLVLPKQQQQLQQQAQTMSSSSSGQQSSNSSSNKSSSTSSGASSSRPLQSRVSNQQPQQIIKNNRIMMMTGRSASNKMMQDAELEQNLSQQQDSSDGYIATTNYNDYTTSTPIATTTNNNHNNTKITTSNNSRQKEYWRHQASSHIESQQQQQQDILVNHSATNGGQSSNYRHFDPYSIYSEEDDVWYSEERLFEDHLEEIFNKWRLLDDEIWCKLIIMERNRRIGKAYARVPIVTIDGSHELSYDGHKLALNGFENLDRDEKTEECRKRIGKGIRIKMDNFGNILIKRLSKSGVYIKEWLQLSNQNSNNQLLSSSSNNGLSSNSTTTGRCGGIGNNGSSGNNTVMPSRQQLIKNQMLALNGGRLNGSQISSLGTSITTPSNSSSSGSSIDPPNDSAICDEVLSVGGRLDLDKIYVMFDMKKFQANITQELCRAYPDKRKLEQQCFSIVGLARDSDDILNLPCWVMVINIVAIEMLNVRFPILNGHQQHQQRSAFPDTVLLENSRRSHHHHQHQQQPNFVSIFEQNNNDRSSSSKSDNSNKEEDPYSLPANASSSDVKSSINDYGSTSTKNISAFIDNHNNPHHQREQQQQQQQHQISSSRYYGASRRAEIYAHKKELSRTNDNGSSNNHMILDNMKHRSKSNCNIYGPPVSNQNSSRHNNSSSIYSPGHMLVPPPSGATDHPPKLPPRDFVKKTKSKSSSNVNYDEMISSNQIKHHADLNHGGNSIYSTGKEEQQQQQQLALDNSNKVVRKTKKNRFLESLKAPLELAKSSSSRSASVMGAPVQSITHQLPITNDSSISKDDQQQTKLSTTTKSSSKTKSATKNLKSFLGVKGSSKSNNNITKDTNNSKDTASDDSNYVHVDEGGLISKDSTRNDTNVEVDSVVDSNESIDDSQQVATNSSSSASFNDLDIPTPDYETDENIYAIEDSNYREFSTNETKTNTRRMVSNNSNNNGKNLSSKTNANRKSNKEDLYYSGFLAHIPQNNYYGQTNHQTTTGAALRSASSIGVGIGGGGGGGKSSQYLDCSGSAIVDNTKTMSSSSYNTREKSRFFMHKNGRMLNSNKQLSGRDMIYGSTTGLPSMAGSRYRSTSMQRYYPRTNHIQQQQQHHHQYHQVDLISKQQQLGNELYDPDHDLEDDPYTMSGSVVDVQGHYGITGHRRRLGSKLNGIPYGGGGGNNINSNNGLALHRVSSSMANSNYDIGRSSSGIYGNNSSSSSSDYADWHPQMRKVNSSGYLNSIFKNHISSPVDPFNNHHSNVLKNNNNNNNTTNSNVYNNSKQMLHQQQQQQQQRNGTSRALKLSSRQTPTSVGLSKQQQQPQSQQQSKQPQKQAQQVASSIVNGPTYRSYDSSNDSEPSYTNSSDGLDIYDQIGAHARLNHHNHHHHNHHQFLDLPGAHNLAPEVHVGEWENMYER